VVRFSPIAFSEWFAERVAAEVSDPKQARTIRRAVMCSGCGASYDLLVPASTADEEIRSYKAWFRKVISRSCRDHPPVLQMQ
jgi:transcription elongation factor Elf1